MGRKFECVKGYRSGEWLTKGKFYEEDQYGLVTYDDGWKDNVSGFFNCKEEEDCLIEIKEEEKSMERSIHITTDGTTTHAVLKDGKDVIKRATVGLYYKDEYKFETGVMEVVKKLLGIVDEKIEAKEGGNFSVRCVKDGYDEGLTIGKVYEFVDGYSKWNDGEDFPQYEKNGINRFRNIDDLNKWLNDKSYKFELVEKESKSLPDYTIDELLGEIKRRVK